MEQHAVGRAGPGSASGKVLLAFTDTQDPRWEEVRERLWAVSHGERDPETASVSAPVFGAMGELVGALALSGPKARFDMASTITVALTTLLECAKRATVALGGMGARFDGFWCKYADRWVRLRVLARAGQTDE